MVLGGIAGIAAATWVLAGGDAMSVWPFTVEPAAAVDSTPAGGVPVHLDSVPTGADVLVDGIRRGQTPLVASLVSGPHAVTLRHPEMLDVTQTVDVPEDGASAVIRLWRQRPSVLPLGAVYPGATLADARFLADGQVALVIGLPATPAGGNDTLAMHEVWRLDPSTGQLAPVTLAGVDLRATVVALAPDGQQVAYVTAGPSPSASTSLSLSVGPAPASSHQDTPAVLLSDRMACLRAGIVANVVVPHPDYVQFATHYRFRPDFCEGADPESKGIVENLCGYAQRDLVVPALLEPEWPDLAAANAAARVWCAEVNGQVHSEICAVPAERLVTEREVLRLLPTRRPPLRAGEQRTVDKRGTVRFGSARYLVPTSLVDECVEVLAHEDKVVIRHAGAEDPP